MLKPNTVVGILVIGLLCVVGFGASLAAMLIGFVPPSQFGDGSPWVYLAIVGGGLVIVGLLVPFLFYKLRKPSWRNPADAAAAAAEGGAS